MKPVVMSTMTQQHLYSAAGGKRCYAKKAKSPHSAGFLQFGIYKLLY